MPIFVKSVRQERQFPVSILLFTRLIFFSKCWTIFPKGICYFLYTISSIPISKTFPKTPLPYLDTRTRYNTSTKGGFNLPTTIVTYGHLKRTYFQSHYNNTLYKITFTYLPSHSTITLHNLITL